MIKVTILLETDADESSVLDGVLASLNEIEMHIEAECCETAEVLEDEVSVEEV